MIEAEALCKKYKRRTVVDGVTFTCPPGSVTGFLGPNGAGKSTTLRMLAGFTRPDSGRALFAGHRYQDLPRPATVVGLMLDASALHPGRTGLETLRLHVAAIGCSAGREGELLAEVGLSGAEKKRVGDYSLGMRQRLGIAVALVGQPQIVVLDEPYNGLDPEGVYWIRQKLRSFADDGGTVLLSSHMLSEVREAVDRVVIISEGRATSYDSIDQLGAERLIQVRPAAPNDLEAALKQEAVEFERNDDGSYNVRSDLEFLSQLLFEKRVRVVEVSRAQRNSIEDLYFSSTTNGTLQ